MIDGKRVRLWEQDEGRTNITYGHWHEDREGEWVVPERATYSDYSVGMVERANYESFVEAFAEHQEVEWLPVHGGHGTTGFIIRVDADERVPEIGEFFGALENYPVIDDERLSRLEMEAIDEAWDSYGRSDFTRHMRKLEPRLDELLSEAQDSIIDRMMLAVAQAANESPTAEDAAGSVSFRPYEHVLDDVNREDEDALLVAFDLASSTQANREHHRGEQSLNYLFQELSGGQWNKAKRMNAFYYALLEFNPLAARAIGNRPNALDFALDFGEGALVEFLGQEEISDMRIVAIAERMGRALPKDRYMLEVLADAIEESPADEDGDVDFSTIYRMLE